MFSQAKIDDRVWSLIDGWGIVIENYSKKDYPILVKFDDGKYNRFTIEGKCSIFNLNPTLFWNEIKFEIPQPPKRKVTKTFEGYININKNKKANGGMFYSTEDDAKKSAPNHAVAVAVKVVGEYEDWE